MWRGEGFFFGSTRSVSRRRNDDHDDDDGQKQPTRESVRCPFLVGDGGSREGGAPASRPRGSRPRARLDAHLLLRQAERHQQALPQPHAGVGGDGARARARRARESGDERVRPRRDTRARDFDFSSTEEVSAARARGKKAALVAVAFSSRRRLRCIRVTPRRNGRRSQGRQTPQTRGAWPLTLGARPFATRRAPSIARSRLVDFLRSIPSARRESTRCLERSIDARSRLSPPFRSQPPLPSSRTLFTASYTRRRMAATTAAAAAAGSALPR